MRAASRRAGELRGDQLTLLGGAIQNCAGDWRADHGCIELRFRVIELPLGLQQLSTSTFDLFRTRADLHQLKSFLQRVHALLIGIEFGGRVIELLMRNNACGGKLFDAIQSCLVIDQRGAGFVEIMLRFLNLFRTRAVLKLVEISLRVIDSSFGLLVGSA